MLFFSSGLCLKQALMEIEHFVFWQKRLLCCVCACVCVCAQWVMTELL